MTLRMGLAASWLVLAPLAASAQVFEYYHLDAVGSVRVVTDASGAVVERHDYLPFGEEWQATGAPQPLRFTGKERDAETGLDYFGARYLQARIGRFGSVDPAAPTSAYLVQPQRWNRYTYGLNNPFRYSDPTGAVVDVSQMSSAEQDALTGDLNQLTGNTYGVDGAGRLTLMSAGPGASETATTFLYSAMASENTYWVIAENAAKSVLMAEAHPDLGIILIDFKDHALARYGRIPPETYGLGASLVHELAHAHWGLQDPPEDLKAQSVGGADDLVNCVRSERGLPTRGPGYTAPLTFFGGRAKVNFQRVDPQRPDKVFYVTIPKE